VLKKVQLSQKLKSIAFVLPRLSSLKDYDQLTSNSEKSKNACDSQKLNSLKIRWWESNIRLRKKSQ